MPPTVHLEDAPRVPEQFVQVEDALGDLTRTTGEDQPATLVVRLSPVSAPSRFSPARLTQVR